jgi:hypothetical protein
MDQKYFSSRIVSGLVMLLSAAFATHPRGAFAQDAQAKPSIDGADSQTTSLERSHVPVLASSSASVDVASLPDAPMPQNQQEPPLPQSGARSFTVQPLPADGSATISGLVQDVSEAAIAGAQVTLTNKNGSQQRVLMSGTGGEFAFTQIPAGSYFVFINVTGLAPFKSGEIVVTAQQSYEMPNILLAVASTTTEVTVRPTEVIAAEQIKAEEKQRVAGVIPNFYTSYIWDAAPLNTKQKFKFAARDTFDPASFVGISLTAGIEQANNSFSGYGQGASGYAKRWAARFADGRTSDFLSHAVFPSLFHQDPRYFYQGSGSAKSRAKHAVISAFVARSDSGHSMPNYSYFLGDMFSGALSNAYYPQKDRGANLVFTNAAIGLAGKAGSNLVIEFLSKRVTTHVPGNGKP